MSGLGSHISIPLLFVTIITEAVLLSSSINSTMPLATNSGLYSEKKKEKKKTRNQHRGIAAAEKWQSGINIYLK